LLADNGCQGNRTALNYKTKTPEYKDEAEKAISGLNGKDIKGRSLTVKEARPRTDRPRTSCGGRGQLNRQGDNFIRICFSSAPARRLGFATMIPSNYREGA